MSARTTIESVRNAPAPSARLLANRAARAAVRVVRLRVDARTAARGARRRADAGAALTVASGGARPVAPAAVVAIGRLVDAERPAAARGGRAIARAVDARGPRRACDTAGAAVVAVGHQVDARARASRVRAGASRRARAGAANEARWTGRPAGAAVGGVRLGVHANSRTCDRERGADACAARAKEARTTGASAPPTVRRIGRRGDASAAALGRSPGAPTRGARAGLANVASCALIAALAAVGTIDGRIRAQACAGNPVERARARSCRADLVAVARDRATSAVRRVGDHIEARPPARAESGGARLDALTVAAKRRRPSAGNSAGSAVRRVVRDVGTLRAALSSARGASAGPGGAYLGRVATVIARAAVVEVARKVDAGLAARGQPWAARPRALAYVADGHRARARDSTSAAAARTCAQIRAGAFTRDLSRPEACAVWTEIAARDSVGARVGAGKVERGRSSARPLKDDRENGP